MGYVSATCSSGLVFVFQLVEFVRSGFAWCGLDMCLFLYIQTFLADLMMLCSEIYDSQGLSEPQESVEIQRFCEDICKLILRWYMFNDYQFLLNQFSYKVVSEIDMLSTRVLHWVLS